MTISTTNPRVIFTGNGSTKAFATSFKFAADADLVVILRTIATEADVVKTLTTHYTVTGAGLSSGGTVTMGTAPADGTEQLIIYNDPALTQTVDYVSGDAFPAETHEGALDKLTLQHQRTRDLTSRSITLADGDTVGDGTYVTSTNRFAFIPLRDGGDMLTAPGVTDDQAKIYIDSADGSLKVKFDSGNVKTLATDS